MLQAIKKLLERNSLLIAIIATLFLAVLSLSAVPKLNMGLGIKSGDKYLHFIAYFGLTILWYFALKDRIKEKMFKFFVPLALVLYGIILEGLQSNLTTYRTGDIYDAIANTAGVIVALLVFNRLLNWYRTI